MQYRLYKWSRSCDHLFTEWGRDGMQYRLYKWSEPIVGWIGA